MFLRKREGWKTTENNFTEQVRDAVGQSIKTELFDANLRVIDMLQNAYEVSETQRIQIEAKLAELRSINF